MRDFARRTAEPGTTFFSAARLARPDALACGDVAMFTFVAPAPLVALATAMSAGLAIVAFDLPATAELCPNDESALLVRPAQPAPMAAAILRLIEEPDLADRLGCSARRRAAAFSPAGVRAHLEEFYTRCRRLAAVH